MKLDMPTNPVQDMKIQERDNDLVAATHGRGIFIADAIQGTGTVIARVNDNRYAFYRGKTHLGAVQQAPQTESAPNPDPAAPPSDLGFQRDGGLLRNVINQNSIIQQEQRGNFKQILNNKNPGSVKASLAK